MLVTHLSLRDFRSYEAAELRLGPRRDGRAGAATVPGKTNLLEALYVGLHRRARAARQTDREVVRFGARAARVELTRPRRGRRPPDPRPGRAGRAAGRCASTVSPPTACAERRGAAPRRRLPARSARARQGRARAAPGPPRPGGRGAVARPGRDAPRLRAGAGPAQRPAGPCAGRRRGASDSLRGVGPRAGDATVSSPERRPCGRDRRAGAAASRELAAEPRPRRRRRAGLPAALARRDGARRWRPSCASACAPTSSAASPTHGPHRDDLVLSRERARPARLRLAGPAAPRAAGAAARRARGHRADARRAALMLLDDVMSELDAERRERLVARLTARRRPERHHDDRPRPRAGEPDRGQSPRVRRSSTGRCCRMSRTVAA